MPGRDDQGCSLNGLATQWDETPSIRERLRAGEALVKEVSSKQVDVHTPATFADVFLPLCKRMAQADQKVPYIDDLRLEVSALMEFNKREVVDHKLNEYAWIIRKSLGFIKMKCRRNEPSVDTWHDIKSYPQEGSQGIKTFC